MMRKKQGKEEHPFEIINDETGAPESTAESVGVEPLTPDEAAAVMGSATPSELDELKQQLAKAASDHLYLRAEYDNYRRQSIKERSDLVKFGGERLAKDLLETLDIFDTALSVETTSENFQEFVKGIQLTAQQLRGALQKHNITEIPSQGEAFNPVYHEALGSEPSSEIPPGHITRIYKKAYKYHDKVIRPGQVVIATEKNKKE